MRKLMITGLLAICAIAMHPMSASAVQESGRTSTVETKETKIPFEVKYVFNRDITPGRVKKVTDGLDGRKITTTTHWFENGVKVDTETKTETVPAKDAVFHMGKAGFLEADRGSFNRASVKTMESTAYLPTDGSGHGRTASGLRAKFGVVAVDPKVIKIGTLLYVEGYGFAVAADTGGAIKGNKIDVCMHDKAKALKWGRRKVQVHIFRERFTEGMARKYRSAGT